MEGVPLNNVQKTILKERYLQVLTSLESRCSRLATYFHVSRLLITVGSLIVPALLSIQYTNTGPETVMNDPGSFAYRIYWATWIISLLVTTSNGIVSVFKIDKKYYFLHTALEQLRSEGWQYLQLSGRYSGFYNHGAAPTHNNQFVFFCHTVEKIKMKQVEEEYYKLTESHSTATSQPGAKTGAAAAAAGEAPTMGEKKDTIVPPTPLNSLVEQAQQLPPELLQQIYTMVTASNAATAAAAGAKGTAVPEPRATTKNLVDTIDSDAKKGVAAAFPTSERQEADTQETSSGSGATAPTQGPLSVPATLP